MRLTFVKGEKNYNLNWDKSGNTRVVFIITEYLKSIEICKESSLHFIFLYIFHYKPKRRIEIWDFFPSTFHDPKENEKMLILVIKYSSIGSILFCCHALQTVLAWRHHVGSKFEILVGHWVDASKHLKQSREPFLAYLHFLFFSPFDGCLVHIHINNQNMTFL